jgi:uroporphyrinogen decarboxylase
MDLRKRILDTMAHRQTDRIPTILDARAEVQEALVKHYGVQSFQEVLDLLGTEEMYRFPTDGLVKIHFPGFEDRAERIAGPWMGGGQNYIRIDETAFQDAWGVVRRIGGDGKFVEWVSGPLADASDPDEYDFPGPERIVPDPQLPERMRNWKEQGLFVRALVSQPYKTAWILRGMENLLMDYILNRPFVEKLYDKIYALQGEILRICTAAGADLIGFDGDIATQDSVIMGPERWREVDKPRLEALVRSCRQINPDVHAFIHSDGDIREILPDLIEIGFDVIDPIQPECMPPEEVKREYGDRITLHRCGSLQQTLPFGTPEDCRQEARRLVETCGLGGGLVLGASNTVSFDVPVQNIAAWYEAVRDYNS